MKITRITLVVGEEHLIEKVRMVLLRNTDVRGECLYIEHHSFLKGMALKYHGDEAPSVYYMGFATGCYTTLQEGEVKPRHTHDCDRCVFLGQHEEYDLYFCKQVAGFGDTVIARFGSEGPDYSSGIGFDIPYLQEAERLAREKGLLK